MHALLRHISAHCHKQVCLCTCSPARADLVAALGETTGTTAAWHSGNFLMLRMMTCHLTEHAHTNNMCLPPVLSAVGVPALQAMLLRMQASETGKLILKDKPRVTVSAYTCCARCEHIQQQQATYYRYWCTTFDFVVLDIPQPEPPSSLLHAALCLLRLTHQS